MHADLDTGTVTGHQIKSSVSNQAGVSRRIHDLLPIYHSHVSMLYQASCQEAAIPHAAASSFAALAAGEAT